MVSVCTIAGLRVRSGPGHGSGMTLTRDVLTGPVRGEDGVTVTLIRQHGVQRSVPGRRDERSVGELRRLRTRLIWNVAS